MEKQDLPDTQKAPSQLGEIIKKSDGYYLIILTGSKPAFVPDLSTLSIEVINSAALKKADTIASRRAEELMMSDSVTGESAIESPFFMRTDYLIGGDYMKPFIDKCFTMDVGQKALVKSLNKYYVVWVLQKDRNINDPLIRSQVLREKRDKYVKDWFKKEREMAAIKANI